MLTSFEAISLYAVLSGLSGLSVGRWLLPSDRALDRAWEDGWARGKADVWQREDDAYWRGRDDELNRWERSGGDGLERDDSAGGASRPALAGDTPVRQREEHDRAERAAGDEDPEPPAESGGVDWADELGGIRTQIAVDDATEVLAAQPDPPSPGSFEYYLSDWQRQFDHWLAGRVAELADVRRRYERV